MGANTGQHGTLVTKQIKAWIGKSYIAGKRMLLEIDLNGLARIVHLLL
jgi:hypothetical protein